MMKYGESGVASIQFPSGYTMNSAGSSSPDSRPPMMAWESKRSPLSCSDGPSSSRTRLIWSPKSVTTRYSRSCELGSAASSSSSRITALSRIDRSPDVMRKIEEPPWSSSDSFALLENS